MFFKASFLTEEFTISRNRPPALLRASGSGQLQSWRMLESWGRNTIATFFLKINDFSSFERSGYNVRCSREARKSSVLH